jgi:hypothetical protein
MSPWKPSLLPNPVKNIPLQEKFNNSPEQIQELKLEDARS